jgi:hypothetical protein
MCVVVLNPCRFSLTHRSLILTAVVAYERGPKDTSLSLLGLGPCLAHS